MTSNQSEDSSLDRNPPIEVREAQMARVDFSERIITVIAVPYEQRTKVPWNGQMWDELFLRGSFNGIQTRQRFSVNRDHDKQRTVGKVVQYFPDRAEGLVIDAHISATPLGDETLQLAHDDALSGSVGFVARPSDQLIDRRSMTRQIKRAFLDHLAFVPDPAYEGAQVISVRGSGVDTGARIHTPALDQFWSDPLFGWVNERLEARSADKR